ncbi:MAG: DNA repair protein RadA [Spirochaetales bacterium]|nr:DNA repair protein RadA [Spirochaetales bacterium]
MAKDKIRRIFTCRSCDHIEPKWMGRCPSCGEWNTFIEGEAARKDSPASREAAKKTRKEAELLSSVEASEGIRLGSTLTELDRVLGGGIVKGSTILVGGEPGIGKSTLMLQTAAGLGMRYKTLYLSGEESPGQIRRRADRLGLDSKNLHIYAETELGLVDGCLRRLDPELVIVDSIQTLHSPDLGAVPGTVNQIKYCCHEIAEWARERGASVFFIGHVTKEGAIAGPKIIEHMVDTVLYFDQSGGDIRFLRAAKNRFGSVDEIGLFSMTEKGLVQVSDPSALFLVEREGSLPPGVVPAPVYEGSRVLLVEIQALTVPAKGGLSRVYSDRIDPGRVSRIAAVLEKHASLRFSDQDVYVNVAGGIRLTEVGIELPLAMALYSARTGLPFPESTTVSGEVSLAGEIRPVPHFRRRLRAAAEMGFTAFIGPEKPGDEDEASEGWIRAASVTQSIQKVFGAKTQGSGI